jgi:drug/metabolite transporter (DMT)-like permease
LLAFFSLIFKKLQKIRGSELKVILLLAFLEPFMYFIGESFGIRLVSSTVAAVIISTIPLFSPLAARYFLNEQLTRMNYAGILISIIGVILVIFDDRLAFSASLPGVVLMALAVLAAVFYSVVNLRLSTKYNVVTIITYQNAIGVIFFFPLFLVFESESVKYAEFSVRSLIPLFELAIFASTLAFLCFTYSLKYLGISKANVFVNLIPVFTAIFAYFLIDEKFTLLKLSGILVVILGLFVSQVKPAYMNFFSGQTKTR